MSSIVCKFKSILVQKKFLFHKFQKFEKYKNLFYKQVATLLDFFFLIINFLYQT